MTLITEIGDKTFCIAAIMAMRSNRLVVFVGCVGALLVMTFLSVVIGVAVPAIFSPQYTHYISILLFVYFGVDMLRDAARMSGHGPSDELAEAEAELAEITSASSKEEGVLSSISSTEALSNEETDKLLPTSVSSNKCVTRATVSGGGEQSPLTSETSDEVTISIPEDDLDPEKKLRSKQGGFIANLWREKAVLTQAFTIIFFAEWGDKSQIATIAMASSQDPLGGMYISDVVWLITVLSVTKSVSLLSYCTHLCILLLQLVWVVSLDIPYVRPSLCWVAVYWLLVFLKKP